MKADAPIPPDLPLYYFEMTIKNRGLEGFIGIGFQVSSVNLMRLPGWEPRSYGWVVGTGDWMAWTLCIRFSPMHEHMHCCSRPHVRFAPVDHPSPVGFVLALGAAVQIMVSLCSLRWLSLRGRGATLGLDYF